MTLSVGTITCYLGIRPDCGHRKYLNNYVASIVAPLNSFCNVLRRTLLLHTSSILVS
jgi:hypothetical protein